jgi:amino acid transporter
VQGDFPAVFARIHRSFCTPHISIVVYSVALFVFAAMGDFRWNAILSAATRLVVYGAMAVALIVMRKRNGPAPFPLPAGILFSAASMVIVLMLLGHVGKGEGIVVGQTAAVALANWVTVRKS